eukprot:SAG31_NODE_414_length_15953_cov_2.982528_16_plen_167_part_00
MPPLLRAATAAAFSDTRHYRVTLYRLVPDFSVCTWEIRPEKSHEIEKVTVLTALSAQARSRLWRASAACACARNERLRSLRKQKQKQKQKRLGNAQRQLRGVHTCAIRASNWSMLSGFFGLTDSRWRSAGGIGRMGEPGGAAGTSKLVGGGVEAMPADSLSGGRRV